MKVLIMIISAGIVVSTQRPDVTVSRSCPDGFYSNQGSQKCYRLYQDKERSWFAASSFCKLNNLRIAKIDDPFSAWNHIVSNEELHEIDFKSIGGKAKATSEWGINDREPIDAFIYEDKYGWMNAEHSQLPQLLWYEFPVPMIIRKFSFRSQQQERGMNVKLYGPSKYKFWSSNNIDCSSKLNRNIIFEDLSGTEFTQYSTKGEVVNNINSYKCYGIEVLESPHQNWTSITGVRMYVMNSMKRPDYILHTKTTSREVMLSKPFTWVGLKGDGSNMVYSADNNQDSSAINNPLTWEYFSASSDRCMALTTDIYHAPKEDAKPAYAAPCTSRFWTLCEASPDGFFLVPGTEQIMKIFNQTLRSWEEARDHCLSQGLLLAETEDPVSLRKYLVDIQGVTDHKSWLNGKSGTRSIWWWSNNQVIPGGPSSSDDLWLDDSTTDHCVSLVTQTQLMEDHPTKPFFSDGCKTLHNTICELK